MEDLVYGAVVRGSNEGKAPGLERGWVAILAELWLTPAWLPRYGLIAQVVAHNGLAVRTISNLIGAGIKAGQIEQVKRSGHFYVRLVDR